MCINMLQNVLKFNLDSATIHNELKAELVKVTLSSISQLQKLYIYILNFIF